MSCDCIKKLEKEIEAKHGEFSWTNTVTMIRTGPGIKDANLRIAPPNLRFSYYAKGKKGQPTKKIKSSFVSPNYCQFCGVIL